MISKIAWLTVWVTLTFWMGRLWGCAAPGDDQNFKLLEENTPQFIDTERPGLQSREDIARNLGISLVETEAERTGGNPENMGNDVAAPMVEATREESEPTPDEGEDLAIEDQMIPMETQVSAAPKAVAAPMAGAIALTKAVGVEPTPLATPEAAERIPANPVNDAEPSLISLDRSNWDRVVFTAAKGTIFHNPIYFSDNNLRSKQQGTAGSKEAAGTDLIDGRTLVKVFAGPEAEGWTAETNIRDLLVQPIKFALDLISLPIHAVQEPPHTYVSSPPPATDVAVETAGEPSELTPEAGQAVTKRVEISADLPQVPTAHGRLEIWLMVETPADFPQVPVESEAPTEPGQGLGDRED